MVGRSCSLIEAVALDSVVILHSSRALLFDFGIPHGYIIPLKVQEIQIPVLHDTHATYDNTLLRTY
jgi:hypothetical protein